MFILYAVILGILAGFIAGGKLSQLTDVHLRFKLLAILPFLLQLILFSDIPSLNTMPVPVVVVLHIITYLSIIIFVIFNMKVKGIAIIGLGILLNFITIALNGGHMPTSLRSIPTGNVDKNVIGISKNTLLPWLGDIFHLPSWLPLSNAFSIGDVLIAVGAFTYLIINMRSDNSNC